MRLCSGLARRSRHRTQRIVSAAFIGDEQGRIVSEAIGDKRSILLAHHGQLCACMTIGEAAVMSLFIERAARLQLPAMSAGRIHGSIQRSLTRHTITALTSVLSAPPFSIT